MKILADAYPAAYQTLYQAKPITCSVTGATFDAVPVPCAVILDVSLLRYHDRQSNNCDCLLCFHPQFFALTELNATRAVSGHSVPVITCITSGAGAIIRSFGPESIGGMGDARPRIDAEAARTGLSADEIGNEVLLCFRTTSLDGLINIIFRYIRKQKENSLKFLVSLPCMTTNFSRRRYDVFDLTEPFLTNI